MKKVALITGGSRGIGAGIARALARDGFTVAISGRRSDADVQPLLGELRSIQPDSTYIQADVSNTDSRLRLVEELKKSYDRLDVLVNNAGIAPRVRADILEESEDSYDE